MLQTCCRNESLRRFANTFTIGVASIQSVIPLLMGVLTSLTWTCLASVDLPGVGSMSIDLPASANGTLHVLLLGPKPVARSYDGHAWERTRGDATLDLRCEGTTCMATIAETAAYKV